MRAQRGFTLLELATVVAIMGILAAIAIPVMRAGRRNATVGASAFELQMRIEQLPFVSLAEQVEHLLVVVDVPNNDPSGCGTFMTSKCMRVFDLREPDADWKLSGFNPDSPGDHVGAVVDELRLGAGIAFYLPASATARLPRPFDTLAPTFKTFDPELTADCAGSRRCVAYRFRTNGQVAVEPRDPATPPAAMKSGHAFALGSDLSRTTKGADQRAVMVAIPSGIARTFGVAAKP